MATIKKRFTTTLSGNNLSVYYEGKMYMLAFESDEAAVESYKRLDQAYQNEDWDVIEMEIDPNKRIPVNQYIEKDRQGNLYATGISEAFPSQMQDRLKKFIEQELPVLPLVNFWKLLLTNPNPDVKQDLFKFADRFQFPITTNGYFIAYKSVLWKGNSYRNYLMVVSSNFIYLLANGKNPSDYALVQYGVAEDDHFKVLPLTEVDQEIESILKDSREDFEKRAIDNFFSADYTRHKEFEAWDYNREYEFEELLAFAVSKGYQPLTDDQVKAAAQEDGILFRVIGNLTTEYQNMLQKLDITDEDGGTYTDIHTRKMTIKLGQPVSMPMKECDTNRNHTCSSGLHVGAPGYVKNFDGNNPDQYILACLVNPAKVAAVPVDYSYEKMRTSEYYPFAVCRLSEEGIEEVKSMYFEFDYLAYEIKEIEAQLADKEISLDENIRKVLSSRLVDLTKLVNV